MLCLRRASTAALVSFASFQLVEHRSHLPDRARWDAPLLHLRRQQLARLAQGQLRARVPAVDANDWVTLAAVSLPVASQPQLESAV